MTFTEQEIADLRADTPGCERLIHLNNAGAALQPSPVLKAVRDYLDLESKLGGYEAELAAQPELEAVYQSLGRLVGGDRSEIALTQNATRAWDMVFYALEFKPGDRLLTCRAEYASNYIAFLQRARRLDLEIVVLDNDAEGAVCLQSLASNLDERVKLVAINHIPTNGGLVQPAAQIGALLKDHPAVYLLDACQSVGQMPLSVAELGCDALSATSRKYLRGPRGMGFLWCKSELIKRLEPPMLDLHAATWTSAQSYELRDDARRFETWEGFVAGRLGLAAAAEYALSVGPKRAWLRLCDLAATARQRLSQIRGVQVHDLGKEKGGIVTFTVAGHSPDRVKVALAGRRINVWTCSVNAARLDMEARDLKKVVRASFHYYNTVSEVEQFLRAISELSSS